VIQLGCREGKNGASAIRPDIARAIRSTGRHPPVTGFAVALCTSLALLPLVFVARQTPRRLAREGRPPPLQAIDPPQWPIDATSNAGGVGDDAELALLFEADQRERHERESRSVWKEAESVVVAQHDSSRRQRVSELIAAGRVRTGADWYRAAMIYQHGETLDDYARARAYAVQAVARGDEDGLWLAAAAWDRWLIHAGYPQRFGTQSECHVDARLRVCHMYPMHKPRLVAAG